MENDYYPAIDELRDAYLNENGSFIGQEPVDPNQSTETDGANGKWIIEQRANGQWYKIWVPCDASHLSHSATDTAKASNQIPENLQAFLDEHTPEIGAYWKEKEGKCLACRVEIAIQDQYCGECESFLSEMYDRGDN